MTQPNIQNITAKTSEGKKIKDAFIRRLPLTQVDYTELEKRILNSSVKP